MTNDGWAPPQALEMRAPIARRVLRRVAQLPLQEVRSRSGKYVVWTPPSLGGGNHLYMWMYAWDRTRNGYPTWVLEQPGMRAWIDEFPALGALTLTQERVPFRAARGLVWNQEYPGADVMSGFLRHVLLTSRKFQEALHDAEASIPAGGVVLNVRRGDYYSNPAVARNYAMDYPYLLRMVRDVVLDDVKRPIIVVSDDLQWCRTALPESLPGSDLLFPPAGVFGGLALVATGATAILSNSTFSYWGGYLNEEIHGPSAHVWVPRFHSRNSVDGVVWQQSPNWKFLENVTHEMSRDVSVHRSRDE